MNVLDLVKLSPHSSITLIASPKVPGPNGIDLSKVFLDRIRGLKMPILPGEARPSIGGLISLLPSNDDPTEWLQVFRDGAVCLGTKRIVSGPRWDTTNFIEGNDFDPIIAENYIRDGLHLAREVWRQVGIKGSYTAQIHFVIKKPLKLISQGGTEGEIPVESWGPIYSPRSYKIEEEEPWLAMQKLFFDRLWQAAGIGTTCSWLNPDGSLQKDYRWHNS